MTDTTVMEQPVNVDPELETDSPAEQAAPRRPTRELLPTGRRMYAVVGLSAALLIASFVTFGFTGQGFVGAVFCPTLVLLAAIDLEHRLLPTDIIAPAALAIGLIIAIASPGSLLVPHLAAGAALGFFFLTFALVFRGSLGIGDARLGFLIGLGLGSKTFPGVIFGLLGGLVAALIVLARHGLSARKQTLAYGPYLALGGILAFFFA